jgi:hypothetical protein
MLSVWVAVIVLAWVPDQAPSKLFMIDGHAYASRGLCEMAGITKIDHAASSCEEVFVRQIK